MSDESRSDGPDNGKKRTNDDPRHEPAHARNPHLTPPGALGNSDPAKPLTLEQIEAIRIRQERADRQAEREQDKENARLGVRGEGPSGPYLAKKAFDRSADVER